MNSNPDVIIVGSGLFGSMTAKYLRKKGLEVMIIDNVNPMAASKCSFGVWKEGWINKTIKEEVEISMPILKKYYEIVEKPFFNMDKNVEEMMSYLDCLQILYERQVFNYNVADVKNNKVLITGNNTDGGGWLEANKAVIVCAGVWTPELLKSYKKSLPKIDRLWGATLEFNQKIDISRFGQWAPYKQNVLLKMSEKKFVFGDGATVKNPKENDERVSFASNRLLTHAHDVIGSLNPDNIKRVNEGYRPYLTKGSKGFVMKHDKNLFSATGGAKNSTILCGFIAKQIFRNIKEM